MCWWILALGQLAAVRAAAGVSITGLLWVEGGDLLYPFGQLQLPARDIAQPFAQFKALHGALARLFWVMRWLLLKATAMGFKIDKLMNTSSDTIMTAKLTIMM